jgi:hypothetical protein
MPFDILTCTTRSGGKIAAARIGASLFNRAPSIRFKYSHRFDFFQSFLIDFATRLPFVTPSAGEGCFLPHGASRLS